MLNLILIFGMVGNLAVGFFLIAKLEPVVWGKRGVFISETADRSSAAFREWDSVQDDMEDLAA